MIATTSNNEAFVDGPVHGLLWLDSRGALVSGSADAIVDEKTRRTSTSCGPCGAIARCRACVPKSDYVIKLDVNL